MRAVGSVHTSLLLCEVDAKRNLWFPNALDLSFLSVVLDTSAKGTVMLDIVQNAPYLQSVFGSQVLSCYIR